LSYSITTWRRMGAWK